MTTPYDPVPRLTDPEWSALAPHLRAPGPGRPIRDLRARMDALFHVASRNLPWSRFSTDLCRTDTLARHFRRLAHAGVWTRLLKLVSAPDCPTALRALTRRIAACHRRAARLLGLPAIVLARRLEQPLALPAPAWLLPDPDLSGTVMRYIFRLYRAPDRPDLQDLLRTADRVMRTAQGRRRIPRCLIPA